MAVLREEFGNPSSVHHFGQRAKAVVDEARSAVAELIGGDPSEVIFTSGGTESDNFALRGAAEALEPSGRRHLISSGIEHEAVLNTLKALARRGWQTTLHAGRRHRPGHGRGADGGAHGPDGGRLDHARQQRDRDHPAGGGADPAGQGARRGRPHRRRADGGQDSGQRQGARRRPAVDLGAQVLRAEGRRRAVGAPRPAAAAVHDRRQAGARTPLGHRERGRHRRHGRGGAARDGQDGRGGVAPRGAARSARAAHPAGRAGHGHQRRPGHPRAEHDATSASIASRPSRCSSRSTSRASPSPRDRRARRARSSRRTCSRRWGCPPHRTQNSIRFSLGAANTEADVDRVVAVLPGVVDKLRSLTRTPVRG